MYLGKESISALDHHINGYRAACAMKGIAEQLSPPFEDFHDFVARKYGFPYSSRGWTTMILNKCKRSEQRAYHEFLRLFDLFRSMNDDANDFMNNWKHHFGSVPLVSFCFRTQLPRRWMRVHSLPEAQRNPRTPDEWETLLFRHNTVLSALFSHEESSEASVYLVCGEYGYTNDITDREDEAQHESLKSYEFTPLETVLLGKEFPQYFSEEQMMMAKFSKVVWKPHEFDVLLQAAAREEIRPFFVSFEKARICGLYEGGMDCILATELEATEYKQQFSSWLSPFSSGL